MTDLFGEVPEPKQLDPHGYGSLTIRKRLNHYRRSDDPKRRCATCAHHDCFEYHDRYYHKCELVGHSSGAATDVRASAVCDDWRLKE